MIDEAVDRQLDTEGAAMDFLPGIEAIPVLTEREEATSDRIPLKTGCDEGTALLLSIDPDSGESSRFSVPLNESVDACASA